MEILGYILALLIGITLGLIGSGGSILSVPILTYCYNLDAIEATLMSLFIVACTSWVGASTYIRKGWINVHKALLFGIPSIVTIFIVRRFLLPLLPEKFQFADNWQIDRDTIMMICFAILMLLSATKMIRNGAPPKRNSSHSKLNIIIQGLSIGLVTGFLGAGGGFLIIPALVIFLRMEMKQAIGTSLLIIALNTSAGFLSNLTIAPIQWRLMLSFTGIAIAGIIFGIRLSTKINGALLKPIFGWFVLIIAISILIFEIFLDKIN